MINQVLEAFDLAKRGCRTAKRCSRTHDHPKVKGWVSPSLSSLDQNFNKQDSMSKSFSVVQNGLG